MNIVVSINKPAGITSQDAVTRVKRILKVKKAGHTGTLDPMATGLLLVCINRATRLSSYFLNSNKKYAAVMKLGESTDTQDSSGTIMATGDISGLEVCDIKEAVQGFQGLISQLPPMYSALKHKGEPLYKLARKGVEVERKPREIMIYDIETQCIDLPFVSFSVACSKGSYIRTLCYDIGKKLGTEAHMSGLQRTAVGDFLLEQSLTFEELEEIGQGGQITKGVYTMDEAMSWMPSVTVDGIQMKQVRNGVPLQLNLSAEKADSFETAPGIRVKSLDGELMAIGSFSALNNSIKMDVVF